MKVLVIGKGGREHALVHAVSRSGRVKKIYAAPGNPGMAELAECVNIADSDVKGLTAFAKEQEIDGLKGFVFINSHGMPILPFNFKYVNNISKIFHKIHIYLLHLF